MSELDHLPRSVQFEESEDIGSNPTSNPTIGRHHRRASVAPRFDARRAGGDDHRGHRISHWR